MNHIKNLQLHKRVGDFLYIPIDIVGILEYYNHMQKHIKKVGKGGNT